MSAHDILLYVYLIFLTILVTIFSNHLNKHIKGNNKELDKK